MKSNMQLQTDVLAALHEEAQADLAEVSVGATDGIVTLAGRVKTHAEKWSIVHTTEHVDGVRAIANDISVEWETDEEIARVILDRLKACMVLDAGKGDGYSLDDPCKIHVQHGWVTLKGTVQSKHQRTTVDSMVRSVAGVRGLSNRIKIKAAAVLRRAGNKTETATRCSSGSEPRREDRATAADALLDRAS
jgi:osmotically-inducible protein OsmY